MSDDEVYEFEDCTAVAETDLAIGVSIPETGSDEVFWIPKSQINDDSEVSAGGDQGSLIIPMWLAEKKGLV